MAMKYTNNVRNETLKITQIGIFGFKMYHPATLEVGSLVV
jgi:hypothetical protein